MTLTVYKDGIRIFILPAKGPLGQDESNYDHVKIHRFTADGEEVESIGKVKFASSGKMGALAGGLLHLADHREKATREEVVQMQKESVSSNLEKKRQGVPIKQSTLLELLQCPC